MKMRGFALATVGALALFAGGDMAAAQQCTGPFASCAIGVGAQCPLNRAGEPVITFYDRGNNSMQFERCVGRIFTAAGQPDPYKTGDMPDGDLPMPAFEIIPFTTRAD